MNNTNLVSIILSAYNSEKTIEKAVNSLLNQSYTNLEILILDDGSTDKTKEICMNYTKKDNRILFFSNNQNIGLTKSLNILAKLSKGEFIARQDADDISLPNRIEKQIRFLESYKLDATTTRSLVMQSNKKRPGYSFYIPNKLLIKFKNPFVHGSLLIKKNILIEIGYYDENFYYAQDYKLFYDLIYAGYKIKTLNEPLYLLNIENNISANNLEEQNYYANCVKSSTEPVKF